MKKFYITISFIVVILLSFIGGYFFRYQSTSKSKINSKLMVNLKNFKGEYNKSAIKSLYDNPSPKIQDTIKTLEKEGNNLLNTTNYPSVTDKTDLIASGETKHDFVSMTPYLYNDSNTKTGYIVKDGVDNPERLDESKFDSQRLAKLVSAVNTLSIDYTLTGKEVYAKKAVDFLNAWFLNSSTKMNPNMKYSEIFVTNSGKTYFFNNSTMISAVPFIQIVNDIYLLEGSNALTNKDLNGLKAWFNDFQEWLLKSSKGNIDMLRIDNHGTWLQAELALFNTFAGNKEKTIKALEAVGPYSICPQIKDSGKIPSALIRTKSVDYTEYNLEAFITLANIGEKLSIPIWDYKSPYGGSIEKALDYLNNYLLGKEKWPYENIKGKNVNEEDNGEFIKYLALAYDHYKNPDYLKTINKYKPESKGISNIILESRLSS